MAPSSDDEYCPNFVFEPPSDEEYSDTGEHKDSGPRKFESPWDFAASSERVAEAHARDGTTSVDFKIAKALQHKLPVPISNSGCEPEPEPDKQEAYKPEPEDKEEEEEEEEEGDDGNAAAGADNNNKKPFFASSKGASFHAESFSELKLSYPLLRALDKLGFTKPTPIQAACVPLAMLGRDICGSAMTGSGKTAAFALPTLEKLLHSPKHVSSISVLVLTPTRELGLQVLSMIQKLAQFTDIRCCQAIGGLPMKEQELALRSMPDIVVATPGRLLDHLCNSIGVYLDDLTVLILDEADRLLEVAFSAEIRELIRLCPQKRQTMLFSATMNTTLDELVNLSLKNPVRLSADPSAKRPAGLTEEVVRIRPMDECNQEAVLLALCKKTFTKRVIVFSRTKVAAHRLKILFGLGGLKAAELHNNVSQDQRLHALEIFKNDEVDFLITTEVISRGIDIPGVKTVINYECPSTITSYIHRVGRTARAGKEGYAVTFVTDNDRSLLKAIAKKVGPKLKSRRVALASIADWSGKIKQMEGQVATILQEEREEQALRKAQMEAIKAENMLAHADTIFSRPKKTYPVKEKEKRMVANAAKASLESQKRYGNEVISAEQAEYLKMKEKKKREREKNMPRKKRRKLEAAREFLEDENRNGKLEGSRKIQEEKIGTPLVDLAYRRAEAVKAENKAAKDVGNMMKKASKISHPSPHRTQSRTDEMREMFQSDISQKRHKGKAGGAGKKNPKHSFKSKSRYEAP
ncbi:hypothetical protein M0R45_003088 [Rubus argutus]|uniref:RNA helicase n=1 Tax=Rubus argutus TaxID=59490 RepID=A0AAW1YEC1_RUBAR